MAVEILEPVVGRGLAELGDMRPGSPVQQQGQRRTDADEKAGQGVEDHHAEHGGDRGEEIGAGRDSVGRAEAPRVDAVEGGQGRHVDELDQRSDDHSRQGCLGQLLE